MAFTIDSSLVEQEGSGSGGIFKFCHRGGTQNVKKVILSVIITALGVNSYVELRANIKKPGKDESERVAQPGIDLVTGEVSAMPLVFNQLGNFEIPISVNISTEDVCYVFREIGSGIQATISSNLESPK